MRLDMRLSDLLQKKYRQDQLPSFVVVKNLWTDELEKEFIQETLAHENSDASRFQMAENLDVLFLTPSERGYLVDDGALESVFKFVSTRPLKLKKKWVVWTKSEEINNTLLNKLLKILEEPPSFVQFLFLTDSKKELLQTIQSRAITLVATTERKSYEDSAMYSLDYTEAFSKVKEFDEEEETRFIQQMVNDINSYKKADEFLKTQKQNDFGRIFHQSAAHRLFALNHLKSTK